MIGMLRKRPPDEGAHRMRWWASSAGLAVAQPILPRFAPPAVRVVFPPFQASPHY